MKPDVEPTPPLEVAPDEMDRVAIKAYVRLTEFWRLSNDDAAALADVAPRTWARMKRSGWSGRLSQDQRLRLSALIGIYKGLHLYFGDELADRWPMLENSGALFQGMTPVQNMQAGGLPVIMQTRNYIDALRGGM